MKKIRQLFLIEFDSGLDHPEIKIKLLSSCPLTHYFCYKVQILGNFLQEQCLPKSEYGLCCQLPWLFPKKIVEADAPLGKWSKEKDSKKFLPIFFLKMVFANGEQIWTLKITISQKNTSKYS